MRVPALALTLALTLAACQATPPVTVVPEAGGGAVGRDVAMPPPASIAEVQGTAGASPLIGRRLSIVGLVVGNFAPGLQGVFVQSERDDGDPRSAEGLFVQERVESLAGLAPGDRVRVSGLVAELGDDGASLTALRDTVVEVIGRGTPQPLELGSAPADPADWERYEGMLLRITAPLTVSGNEGLATYGELTASFGSRLFQPTELAAPGPDAQAIALDNARRRLLLDDNQTSKLARDPWFLPEPLDDHHPVRAGSELRGVTGVLDQRRGDHRLQLTGKLQVRQAPRPQPPSVPGDVRIASLNLLNLFNGDGRGGGFPTGRGARTPQEYQRQQQKLVASVQAMAPDIAALMEVENDGSGPDSALTQFVAALNAAGPIRDYRFVDSGAGPGSDAIRVGMVFRGSRVRALGRPATLAGGPFDARSRVPMAQAFRIGRGPVFVIAANHFKSKGCGREPDQAAGAEADAGQGCWNATRADSARRLDAWLRSDPTGARARLHLIVGDLNAYAQEDPIIALKRAGWRDAFEGASRPYSYVFNGQAGRLDHALLDQGMAVRLRGALEWHSNSDEATAFDYHLDQQGDPYRASDHDPILLGFDLARQRL